MFRRSSFAALVLATTTLLLSACMVDPGDSAAQGRDNGPEPAPRDADAVVTIADMAFSPSMVEIKAGETVAWVWDDGSVVHNVVFDDAPASPDQSEGTWERRFDELGSFEYLCTIHPFMTGTVIVK